MKNAILTFFFAHNYGGVLQAYALKQYLTDIGVKNLYFINYKPEHMSKYYSLNPFFNRKGLVSVAKGMLISIFRINQYVKFEKFIKSKLSPISKRDDLYESVIVGSDQVWNTEITKDDGVYFLKDLKAKIKIAYAPSFGKSNPEAIIRDNLNNLSSFNHLSTRESVSSMILSKELNRSVLHVCDPVFLVSQSVWVKLSKSVKLPKNKFALYYSLEQNNVLLDKAKKYSEDNGLSLLLIHPVFARRTAGVSILRDIGPEEFLHLIINAEVVITNSFHAVSFSMIFRKKIIYAPHKTLGTRTQELLKVIGRDSKNETDFIDFNKTDMTSLYKFINDSKQYLNSTGVGK